MGGIVGRSLLLGRRRSGFFGRGRAGIGVVEVGRTRELLLELVLHSSRTLPVVVLLVLVRLEVRNVAEALRGPGQGALVLVGRVARDGGIHRAAAQVHVEGVDQLIDVLL